MSTISSAHASLIEKLRIHLKVEGYSPSIRQSYPTLSRHFLDYCDTKALAIEAVRSVHLTEFLRQRYRLFSKRHGKLPPFQRWCLRYTGAVHMLLRLAHGRWPVADPPASALEAFHHDIVQDYDAWLRDLRGLQPQTRTKRTRHALRFLASLGPRANQETLARLNVRDIDAYLKQCCSGLRRASIEDCTVCLRDFLRHLHWSGRTAADLSGTVIGPRIYDHETSSAEQVQWIVGDSDSVMLVCETDAMKGIFDGVADSLPECRETLVIEGGGLDHLRSLATDETRAEVNRRSGAIGHDDLATLVYTSGTTGRPKGCVITHGNFTWTVRQIEARLPELMAGQQRQLMFLPLAHIFARIVQVTCVAGGITIGYSAGIPHLTDEFPVFRPTWVFAVPRVFEKIYNGAKAKHADGKKTFSPPSTVSSVAPASTSGEFASSPLIVILTLPFWTSLLSANNSTPISNKMTTVRQMTPSRIEPRKAMATTECPRRS